MSKTSAGGQTALATLEKKLSGTTPDDSVIPASVTRGVRLMLAGGGLTLITGLFWLFAIIADRNSLPASDGKTISNAQFSTAVAEFFILQYLVPTALWIFMARFNRAGAKWSRIVASALAAIFTILIYQVVNSLHDGQTITVEFVVFIVLYIATWIAGVVSIAMIWRGESTAYYTAQTGARRR
jgi:hypothetical protein